MACGSTTSRHAPDPLPATPTQTRTVIEYRKDGAISKMRSHKGNVPVLPQTKLCPHCPAKFTRTTHLNRHLRTHTGERSHCCDTCDAQFTRSDLLTRHKKTCGDPSHANRTRRRSCQACADSKVKCDLQRPCSKCQARGKECTFAVRSSRSFVGTVPSMSATLVDRGPDTIRVATAPPTLVPTTPNSAPNTPPKTNIPPDQVDHASFDWTSSLAMPDGVADRQDALRPLPGGLSPSPSDTYSSASTSDAGPSVTTGSVPSHSPLPPLYSSDFGSFFPPFSGYDNATVGSDNAHAPHDDSPISAAMSSSMTSGDDTLSYATQGIGAQYQFQSTEPVYYAQSSNQQQQIVPQMQRQRYAQDPYAPPFSGHINNIRQQNSSELQHYHGLEPSGYSRPRVQTAVPYQAMRRMPRESHLTTPHFEYADAGQGDPYGRVAERSIRPGGSQARITTSVSTNHHSPLPPETGRSDMLEGFPRYGSDDQTYRSALSGCLVDSGRWSGTHVMRHQTVAGIDLS